MSKNIYLAKYLLPIGSISMLLSLLLGFFGISSFFKDSSYDNPFIDSIIGASFALAPIGAIVFVIGLIDAYIIKKRGGGLPTHTQRLSILVGIILLFILGYAVFVFYQVITGWS